ncbi:hypothetical protein [Fodinicola feengrottensis]|uniref:hypothetical protein n=1 Tax=Fodinicola feengrottensis TaxID=435914 RepID=UPI0013D357A6|nr:hypothetical protein [Fodinicola feengrottensis]
MSQPGQLVGVPVRRKVQQPAGREHGRGRPTAGVLVQLLGQVVGGRVADRGGQQRVRLGRGEGQRVAVQLQQLTATAQPLDRERRLPARGQHNVQVGRRVPAQCLHQLPRSAALGQFVQVVEDQYEVVGLPGQRAEQRERHLVDRQLGVRDGGQQLLGQVAYERGQRRVVTAERVPAVRDLAGPGGQQGGLAIARVRDQNRQTLVGHPSQPAHQRGPVDPHR